MEVNLDTNIFCANRAILKMLNANAIFGPLSSPYNTSMNRSAETCEQHPFHLMLSGISVDLKLKGIFVVFTLNDKPEI